MGECDDGGEKTALPGEPVQPPQTIQRENDRGPVALSGRLSRDIIDGKKANRQGAGARKRAAVLDHARFTAGIIGLYDAVLSEPIPEKMLRLLDAIGKQERKS